MREGQEATAARALWNELGALAAAGPTEAEVNHDREGLAEFLTDPRSVGEEVCAAASAHVTCLPFHSREQQRFEAEKVTPEDIRAAAATFRSNAILSVPQPVELSLPGVVRLAEWSSVGSPPPFPAWHTCPREASPRACGHGEFDAPDRGVQGQRLLARHRHRPGGYRLINGLLVVPQDALAWWGARRADGDWTSWWALLTAVAGLGAVTSLWDTRPAPKAET